MLGASLALSGALMCVNARRVEWIATGLFIVLGSVTIMQSRHWRDSFSLMSHALKVNPQSWIAENNLAELYFAAGAMSEAREHASRAVELGHDVPLAYETLAKCLAEIGEPDRAIRLLEDAIQRWPDDVRLLNMLAVIQHRTGSLEDAQRTRRRMEQLSR